MKKLLSVLIFLSLVFVFSSQGLAQLNPVKLYNQVFANECGSIWLLLNGPDFTYCNIDNHLRLGASVMQLAKGTPLLNVEYQLENFGAIGTFSMTVEHKIFDWLILPYTHYAYWFKAKLRRTYAKQFRLFPRF